MSADQLLLPWNRSPDGYMYWTASGGQLELVVMEATDDRDQHGHYFVVNAPHAQYDAWEGIHRGPLLYRRPEKAALQAERWLLEHHPSLYFTAAVSAAAKQNPVSRTDLLWPWARRPKQPGWAEPENQVYTAECPNFRVEVRHDRPKPGWFWNFLRFDGNGNGTMGLIKFDTPDAAMQAAEHWMATYHPVVFVAMSVTTRAQENPKRPALDWSSWADNSSVLLAPDLRLILSWGARTSRGPVQTSFGVYRLEETPEGPTWRSFYTARRYWLTADAARLAAEAWLIENNPVLYFTLVAKQNKAKENPVRRKFTPSYPADNQADYDAQVAFGKKRKLHVQVDGGRRGVRYQEVQPQLTFDTAKRLVDREPPWDARTQAPKSNTHARSARPDRLESQISSAIQRLTTAVGFAVPTSTKPLIAAGMPTKAAGILVSRAARAVFTGAPAKKLQQADLRTDITAALGRPLALRPDGSGAIVLPVLGRRQAAELTRASVDGQQVLSTADVQQGYAAFREQVKREQKRSYRREQDDPVFLRLIYRTLRDLIRQSHGQVLELTFQLRGQDHTTSILVGEHSKSAGEKELSAEVEYRSLRNVSLTDLPAVLARLSRRKKRAGRRLDRMPR